MRKIEVFWYFASGLLVISYQIFKRFHFLYLRVKCFLHGFLGASVLFLESLTFELYSVIYMNAI
jgi:hypothetical protein